MLAGPSIAPGNPALRQDIQRLADYGVLSRTRDDLAALLGPDPVRSADSPADGGVTDRRNGCPRSFPGQGEMARPSPPPVAQATISIRTGK